MRMLLYLRRSLSTLRACVGGPGLLSWFFRDIPPRQGDRKSHAARELGKTGLRVAAVCCECMSGESLRLFFEAGLKSSSELTEPREQVGRSPAPFQLRQRTPLQAVIFAGGNA